MLTTTTPELDSTIDAIRTAAGITEEEESTDWKPGSIRYLPIGLAPPDGPPGGAGEPAAALIRCVIADPAYPLDEGLPQAWEAPVEAGVATARNTKVERYVRLDDLPGPGRLVDVRTVTDGRGWRMLCGPRIRGETTMYRDRPYGGQWDPWVPRIARRRAMRIGAVLVDSGRSAGTGVWRLWRVLPVGAPVLEAVIERNEEHAGERIAETLDRDLQVVFAGAVATLRQRDERRARILERATAEWALRATTQSLPRRKRKRRGGRTGETVAARAHQAGGTGGRNR